MPKSVGNEIFGRLKFAINRRRKIRLALENFYERGGRLVTDIIDALKHEVAKQKNSKNVVTNSCTIYLNEADCHRLSAARLIRKLCETVERKIIPKQHRADLQSFINNRLGWRLEFYCTPTTENLVNTAGFFSTTFSELRPLFHWQANFNETGAT